MATCDSLIMVGVKNMFDQKYALAFENLNLSNKEIASLLNISVESCRKRKERVTAKLNLDRNVPLYEYLTVHLIKNKE